MLLLLATGCTRAGPSESPVDWWHQLEGGLIGRDRPPPPGEYDPYPKIGTVPAKPEIPSVASRQALYDELVAERERTERIAARDPVPPPVAQPAAAPKATPAATSVQSPAQPGAAPGEASNAAADSAAPNATFAAATPPTRPPSPKPLQPEPPVLAPSVVTDGLDGQPITLPAVYDTPPAPARFEGVAALPAPSPPPPVPVFVPTAQRGTAIDFQPGAAVLAKTATGVLHGLAVRRGTTAIAVTGYGDASSDTPDAQVAALTLGLARARVVADRLRAEGVPPTALHISAEAFGRGAAVLLLR